MDYDGVNIVITGAHNKSGGRIRWHQQCSGDCYWGSVHAMHLLESFSVSLSCVELCYHISERIFEHIWVRSRLDKVGAMRARVRVSCSEMDAKVSVS